MYDTGDYVIVHSHPCNHLVDPRDLRDLRDGHNCGNRGLSPYAHRKQSNDIIMPSPNFDADLGMRSNYDVIRQLQLDVPRCSMRVNGQTNSDWRDVWRTAIYPRMCTQAVFAPVIEWFMHLNFLVHELSNKASAVFDVTYSHIQIRKVLGITDYSDNTEGLLEIRIVVDVKHTFISCTTQFPQPRRRLGFVPDVAQRAGS